MSWLRDKYKQYVDHAKDMSFEKAAKKISIAKQIVKEGTGHADSTSENKLISDNYEAAQQTRFHMKQFYKSMTTAIESGQAYSAHNCQFAYAMKEAGREFADISPEYSAALIRMSEHLLDIENIRSEMFRSIQQNFIDTVRVFAKMDVKNALISKDQNYDSIRVEYDAAKTRQRGKEAPTPEFLDMEERFKDAEIDTIEMLQDVNDKREVDSMLYCISIFDAQETFFVKWIDLIGEMRLFCEETKLKTEERKKEMVQERAQRDVRRCQRLKDKEPISEETRIFGVCLEKLLNREHLAADGIPTFVTNLFDYLEEKALTEEGIFRLSGSKSQIEKIKNDIDRGRRVEIASIADPNIISSLLKMFLRELPESIFVPSVHEKLFSWKVDNSQGDIDYIKHVIKERLLYKTKQYTAQNKMSSTNLSTVFGPNLIRSDDPALMTLESSAMINAITKFFIEEYPRIFDDTSCSEPPAFQEPSVSQEKIDSQEKAESQEKVESPEIPQDVAVPPTKEDQPSSENNSNKHDDEEKASTEIDHGSPDSPSQNISVDSSDMERSIAPHTTEQVKTPSGETHFSNTVPPVTVEVTSDITEPKPEPSTQLDIQEQPVLINRIRSTSLAGLQGSDLLIERLRSQGSLSRRTSSSSGTAREVHPQPASLPNMNSPMKETNSHEPSQAHSETAQINDPTSTLPSPTTETRAPNSAWSRVNMKAMRQTLTMAAPVGLWNKSPTQTPAGTNSPPNQPSLFRSTSEQTMQMSVLTASQDLSSSRTSTGRPATVAISALKHLTQTRAPHASAGTVLALESDEGNDGDRNNDTNGGDDVDPGDPNDLSFAH